MNAYITLHEKDAQVLPYCVRGVRACPEVSRISVIAAAGNAPLCWSLGVSWIDEDGVVPGVRHDAHTNPRWGWYFQQMLKLGVAWLERDDYFLVVDADTVFLHPVRFLSDEGHPLYTTAWEYHAPYFESFERLLGFPPQRETSFIAHHMVFRCDMVREMCAAFRPHPVWWRNIGSSVADDRQVMGSTVARWPAGRLRVLWPHRARLACGPAETAVPSRSVIGHHCGKSAHVKRRDFHMPGDRRMDDTLKLVKRLFVDVSTHA